MYGCMYAVCFGSRADVRRQVLQQQQRALALIEQLGYVWFAAEEVCHISSSRSSLIT